MCAYQILTKAHRSSLPLPTSRLVFVFANSSTQSSGHTLQSHGMNSTTHQLLAVLVSPISIANPAMLDFGVSVVGIQNRWSAYWFDGRGSNEAAGSLGEEHDMVDMVARTDSAAGVAMRQRPTLARNMNMVDMVGG